MIPLILLSIVAAEPLPPDAVRRFLPQAAQPTALERHVLACDRPTRAGDAVWIYDRTAHALVTVAYGSQTVTTRLTFPNERLPRNVVITEDERFVLADRDGDVEVWRLTDGRSICTAQGIRLAEHGQAWSAADERIVLQTDGKKHRQIAAIDCGDGSVRIFERTGDLLGLADRGASAIVGDYDRLSIVDIRTGKEARGLPTPEGVHRYVASPTQDECLALSDNAIQRIDMATLAVRPWRAFSVKNLSFADDGNTVALVTVDKDNSRNEFVTLEALHQPDPPRPLQIPECDRHLPNAPDWQLSGDGKWLRSRRYCYRLRLAEVDGGRLAWEHCFPKPKAERTRVTFMEYLDEDTFITVDSARLLECRSIASGQMRWTLQLPNEFESDFWQHGIVLSPRRDRLTVSSYGREEGAYRIDWVEVSPTRGVVHQLRSAGTDQVCGSCVFNADGTRLLTLARNGQTFRVAIFDATTGKDLRRVDPLPNTEFDLHSLPHAAALCTRGNRVPNVAYLNERTWEWNPVPQPPAKRERWGHWEEPLWTVAASKTEREVDHAHKLASFRRETTELACMDHEHELRLDDRRDPQPFAVLEGKHDAVALSPAGRTFATATSDGTVTVWDMQKLRARKPIVDVALSPAEWAIAWDDLRAHTAEPVQVALWKLERDPTQTRREIARRMPPATKLDPQTITAAFEKLGDAKTRRATYEELRAIDVRIRPYAEVHLAKLGDDSEAARLTRSLAESVGTQMHHANRQAFHTIELLRRMEAVDLLKLYAAGDPEAILTTEAKYALTR